MLVNQVSIFNFSYRSVFVSHQNLKSINSEARDCDEDKKCEDYANDGIDTGFTVHVEFYLFSKLVDAVNKPL